LVQRTRRGDREAFGQLVERYRDAIYGLAYHHVQNFEDARDIAQESFIKAYLRLPQLRDEQKFGPWLRQVTINECKMLQRSRRRVELLSLEELQERGEELAVEEAPVFVAAHREETWYLGFVTAARSAP
jgi:RNA polymerase sigma-70 factor (ECF subfamily)